MRREVFIKKIFLLMALLGCICLAGCGGKEGTNPSVDSAGGSKEAGASGGQEGPDGRVREIGRAHV